MIAAVDAGGTSIKAAAVDARTLAVEKEINPPSNATEGRERYLDAIAHSIQTLAGGNLATVEAVGLSLPGALDRRTRRWCGLPNVADWPAEGLELDKEINKRLGRNLTIAYGNDADLAALGEWATRTNGKPKEEADRLWLVHVTVGTGIGTGHVRNSEVQTGWEGGHIPVSSDPNGPFCGCGRRNCLEAWAAVPRLVGRFRQALRGGGRSQVGWDQIGDREDHKDAGRAIADAAKNGDRLSRAMLIEHAGWLAKGLAGLASIAMPDLITVGGGLANAGDVFIKPLVDAFHREDAGFAGRAIAVEKALLGNEAGFIGAAALARQRMR